MQKTITELVKRIKKFENLKNPFVVYHFDIDGCASASILWRILKKYNVNAEFCPITRGFEAVAMEKIKNHNPDRIVVLDYVPHIEFFEFLKDYPTEILDHHTHEKGLESFDYFTSSDFEVGASLSYLMYKAAEKIGIKKTDWLGRLGSFWDKCAEHTEFYYEEIYKKEMETMFPFNLVVNLTQITGSKKMFELMNMHSDFESALEDVKKMDDYVRAKKLFDSELKEIEFSKKMYSKIDLNVYWVKTKFKHIRIYVDYITYQSDGTKIFILDETTRFKFSIRTSLKINIVDIINKIKEKYPNFSGGGHKQACGAMLRGENVQELLADFITEYKTVIGIETETFKPAF